MHGDRPWQKVAQLFNCFESIVPLLVFSIVTLQSPHNKNTSSLKSVFPFLLLQHTVFLFLRLFINDPPPFLPTLSVHFADLIFFIHCFFFLPFFLLLSLLFFFIFIELQCIVRLIRHQWGWLLALTAGTFKWSLIPTSQAVFLFLSSIHTPRITSNSWCEFFWVIYFPHFFFGLFVLALH